MLFGHDNRALMGVDMLFIATMMAFLWMNTYEIIFGEMAHRVFINGAALCMYLLHILLFNLTEHKNTKQELITDRN